MTWGTYVGGSQEDIAYNVKVATNGDIFICGATTSSNLISTAGTLQVAYNGGMDGFVQRYNAAGVLQSGTYIGTTSYDATYFMDIDANNDVFVFGNTTGVHPISQGVYSNIGSGHFVYKLNNTLTTRIWSTQIGAVNSGTPSITPTAFMVNDCGNIYLAGWGGLTSQFSPRRNSTTGLPVTPNAIRGTTTGDDFYLMILGKNATSLLYGTFFGGASSDNVDGDHVDGGTSRFSKNGVIYHAVCACRGNSVPTTAGAWRTTNAGAANNGCNNLAFKIDLDPFLADFVPIDVATNLAVVNGACSPITVRLRNDSRNATVFQWNLGTFGTSTLREPVVNVTQSGTYSFTMTATNPDYCLGPITITKSIRVDGGVLTVSPDVVICKGQSTNLTASGGLTYTWSPTTGLSNPNIANPIASPTQTTTYTLTSQVSQNCRQQKTVTVTVSESIEPKFIFTLSDLCATFPLVTISNQSNTGGSYTWDFGNGRTFVGQTPTPFRYTTEGTFNIKLTTNAGSSCPLDLTKSITIQKNNNVIIPTISPNVKLCEGDKTQLLATGGTIYSWTPATGLSNTNIPNPIATAIRSTTYTVRISNNQGCFRDTSLVLSVSPPVTPKFTAKLTNDCELFPLVTLTNQSVGALTYLWNFGNGQTSTEENPKPFRYTKAGTYRIILSVRNTDCSRNDTLNLKIDENSDNEFIKFIELAADQNICVGDTVRLAATTGAIIGTTYAWTPTTGLNNANIANPIAIPTQTTRYTARITNKLGCFKDTSILVNVAPKIVLDFDVILEELCEPYPLTRIISRVTGADTYTWTFGNGQTFVGAQPPPYKYTADGNYTISVTGKNANCQKTSSKQSLQTYLVANNFYKQIRVAPRNPSLCLGDKVQLNASGGFRYLWTPATGLSNTTIANPIANPSQSTVYNVRIFNERGCFVDSAVTVAVVPELKVDFELQVSSECGKNGIVKFVNKTTGTGQYKWFLGDGRALTTENPADNSYEKSGEYEVILEVFNGVCSRTKSQKIKVENVNPPNVITPNGDGKNERFVIDNVRNGWKVEIYDRWNKQIYKTDNYQNDWGGDVTNALYYYLLTSPEGKTCKGWVLVVKGEN
jgi:gliding motility-associated-like protein